MVILTRPGQAAAAGELAAVPYELLRWLVAAHWDVSEAGRRLDGNRAWRRGTFGRSNARSIPPSAADAGMPGVR
jgi:hypothetical protein